MFWKRKRDDESNSRRPLSATVRTQSTQALGNTPYTAYEASRAEWAERNGDNTVNQSRFFILALIGFGTALMMGGALWALVPLKTVVPYNITFDRDTGETTVSRITSANFVPDQVQKGYFIGRWVRHVMTLDPFTTERDLSEAFGFVRGKAIGEMREFISSTQPVARLQRDKTLTRTVAISTLQFIDANIAQVRIVTQERTAKASAPQKRFVVTIHFVLDPPATEAQMLENPIGLYIVHFSISEELQ